MIHEILIYENIFILMEKMGNNIAKPLWNPQLCVGVSEEGDLG